MQETAIAVATPAVTLSAPEDFRLPDLGDVGAGLRVAPLEERPVSSILWDTEDLRLARWGGSLAHREGEGWTVELPAEAGGDPAHRVHRVAGEGDIVPPVVIDLVAAFVRTAELQPRLELHSVRRVVGLLDEGGRLLVEVDDHEPVASVTAGAGTGRELEVAVVMGGPSTLLPAVVDRLVRAGATRSDAAVGLARAFGDAGPPEVELEQVGGRSTAAAVVRRAIAAATLRLVAHDPGVRLGGDPEAVHQARVAVRRLRSDLRTFAPLMLPGWSDPLRDELRWIGGELGRVRDAEVLAEEVELAVARLPEEDRAAGADLVADLRTDIVRAREHLLDSMRSPRYVELLEHLVRVSRRPMLLPAADQPARQVLPGLVARPWRRLRRDARRLRGGAADVELHQLRIRAKRARYAAEAGAPVLGRRAAAFARAVARLQDVLGTHHDAVVAAERLRAMAGTGRPAFVAGQLWGVERQVAEASRADWPKAWKRARKRRLRSWMT
jgi:CHAD domain-containing protein